MNTVDMKVAEALVNAHEGDIKTVRFDVLEGRLNVQLSPDALHEVREYFDKLTADELFQRVCCYMAEKVVQELYISLIWDEVNA